MQSTRKFILFSKSFWDETPRLRHQVANLLIDYGHQVIFFEKPDFFLFPKNTYCKNNLKRINIIRSKQLIHHQLRLVDPICFLNAQYEKRSIINKLKLLDYKNAEIINFNYDYYFLRDLFPLNKIITIINDDFVAQAKINNGKHVRRTLKKTCINSDAIFTVSYPLAKQVEKWCIPKIFLPWAQFKYKKPTNLAKRNSILIWAHIDGRFDFDLLQNFAIRRQNLKIDFIGPVSSKVQKKVFTLTHNCTNIKCHGPVDFKNINFNRYFCTTIPYLNNIADINAVTASNKTFQLLSKGLPIVTHGMPNFLNSRAIVKTNSLEEFIKGVDFCLDEFFSLQSIIKKLVSQNLPKDRYDQIISSVNN